MGFSEIDPFAVQVYTYHFPNHVNLGDIAQITEKDIRHLMRFHRSCDLIFGGFPCQDLTSFANVKGAKGLKGDRSGLFFTFLRVMKWVYKYSAHPPRIVIENNASMSLQHRNEITRFLCEQLDSDIRVYTIDGLETGMLQRRRRLFWTNFNVPIPQRPKRTQNWKDVLVSSSAVRDLMSSDTQIMGYNTLYNSENANERPLLARKQKNGWYVFVYGRQKQTFSRWNFKNEFSDVAEPFARTILRGSGQLLLVRNPSNPDQFRLRQFHPHELERLFGLPDGYVSEHCSRTRAKMLLGNAIIVPVVAHIMRSLVTNSRHKHEPSD
jgi:site-specific DNA-cytosine methylase